MIKPEDRPLRIEEHLAMAEENQRLHQEIARLQNIPIPKPSRPPLTTLKALTAVMCMAVIVIASLLWRSATPLETSPPPSPNRMQWRSCLQAVSATDKMWYLYEVRIYLDNTVERDLRAVLYRVNNHPDTFLFSRCPDSLRYDDQ